MHSGTTFLKKKPKSVLQVERSLKINAHSSKLKPGVNGALVLVVLLF